MNKNSEGSVQEILPIAFPIFLSQAIDVAMIFCDRYFLSKLGKEELASTLSGGILNYLVSTLLFGMLGQITSLVGQYYGANQKENSIRTVHQGLILAIIISPVFYILGLILTPKLLTFFGHETKLIQNELDYFKIISLTVITTNIRVIFANFFIGIGKTFIVTVSSLMGVLINIPVSYVLVFGKFGFPKLGIEGAAIGTVIASMFPIILLLIKFYSKEVKEDFNTKIKFEFNFSIMYKIIRYGLPSGIEMFISVGGFLFFTMVMYSYSSSVAAATTIVLNWDMVCFIPLLGISQAVGGLVGKYLGENKKETALRSAYSALKLGWIYSFFITVIYFVFTLELISIFSSTEIEKMDEVVQIGTKLLKISCLYFLFDSTHNVLAGVLRGSGDTIFLMIASNLIMWTGASFTYFFKNKYQFTPIQSWIILTIMIFLLGAVYLIRFLQKKWLNRLMINK